MTRLGGEFAKYNDGVSRHNANCAGKTLPRPAYERCQNEKSFWDGRKATIEGDKGRLLARATDYDRQLAPYTKRMGEIAAQSQRNTAAWSLLLQTRANSGPASRPLDISAFPTTDQESSSSARG